MTGGGRVGDGTLFSEPVLFMNQNGSLFDDRVEYLVYNRQGQQMGVVAQVPRSETRLHLTDIQGRSHLELIRRGEGRNAEILVTSPDGSPIGRLTRHRGILKKAIDDSGIGAVIEGLGEVAVAAGALTALALRKIPFAGKSLFNAVGLGAAAGEAVLDAIPKDQVHLVIDDSGSKRLGVVVAESETPTEFTILDAEGAAAARIAKAPQVLAREQFTNATNYAVEFARPLDEPFRSLALATAVAIAPIFEHLTT